MRHPYSVDVRNVDRLRVGGIDVNARVIEPALAQAPVVIEAAPGGAAVGRAEYSASFRLDDRENDARVARRDVDADSPEDSPRQTRVTRNVGPMRAAVGALVEAASRPAVIERPGRTLRLPHRRVEHARIPRVHHQIDSAAP